MELTVPAKLHRSVNNHHLSDLKFTQASKVDRLLWSIKRELSRGLSHSHKKSLQLGQGWQVWMAMARVRQRVACTWHQNWLLLQVRVYSGPR